MNPEGIRAAGADMVASARDLNIGPLAPESQGAPQPQAADGAELPPSLLALCVVARLHHIPADPAALLHFLGKGSSEPVTIADVLLCAKLLGLKATRTRRDAARLPLTPLPALALMRDGQLRVLAQCDSTRVLTQVPGQRPAVEAMDDFVAAWSGELLLFASRASLAGARWPSSTSAGSCPASCATAG